ncbi:hypothetical protein BQ8420_17395 [Nocardiopsis sp. JB363]|nr:hypothetical protein BQ8420_17395 [Nocardiopsis sp. JB363]
MRGRSRGSGSVPVPRSGSWDRHADTREGGHLFVATASVKQEGAAKAPDHRITDSLIFAEQIGPWGWFPTLRADAR